MMENKAKGYLRSIMWCVSASIAAAGPPTPAAPTIESVRSSYRNGEMKRSQRSIYTRREVRVPTVQEFDFAEALLRWATVASAETFPMGNHDDSPGARTVVWLG